MMLKQIDSRRAPGDARNGGRLMMHKQIDGKSLLRPMRKTAVAS